MLTVGLNRHHNGSVCMLDDGEVVLHTEEERLTRTKYEDIPYRALLKVTEHTDKIDDLVISGMFTLPTVEHDAENFYSTVLYKELKRPFGWHNWSHNHHECHAASAFYNSGFDSALCVVVDGAGSESPNGDREIESIFYAQYPANFAMLHREMTNKNVPKTISVGWMFEAVADYLGFHPMEAGKVMGLASYGKPNPIIPDLKNSAIFRNGGLEKARLPKDFQTNADLAYALQEVTQERVLKLIQKAIATGKSRNVCLSGGYALNCVANYFYLKHLPADVNLYVEPISHDAGTAIGAAKKFWHDKTKDTRRRPQTSIYYGELPDYNTVQLGDGEQFIHATPSDVVDLLMDQNIVALFQGRAESGPRALGNRSILFDPRNPDGRDIVNEVKQRESFRPFAATVLEDEAPNWFEMLTLKDSPFMMYAVDTKPEKRSLIPSVVHVDGTCRIQTINHQQNWALCDLIRDFNRRTGVPMLFNTSFNLAGQPLVESVVDAIWTIRNSKLEYLYFPDIHKLFIRKNK